MELTKLEKYKKEYSDLASKIDSLQSYLKNQDVSGTSMVTLSQVAATTGMDEYVALFILSLAEKEHLLRKKYIAWTNEGDTSLGDYETQADIPDVILDDSTGKEIDRDHFYVEISFALDK